MLTRSDIMAVYQRRIESARRERPTLNVWGPPFSRANRRAGR
jgi:hypothetical protein